MSVFITDEPKEAIRQYLHTFAVINRETKHTFTLQQIGQTREDAEFIIRNYNLKGLDFQTRYALEYREANS